jgi:hypothetical protein
MSMTGPRSPRTLVVQLASVEVAIGIGRAETG